MAFLEMFGQEIRVGDLVVCPNSHYLSYAIVTKVPEREDPIPLVASLWNMGDIEGKTFYRYHQYDRQTQERRFVGWKTRAKLLNDRVILKISDATFMTSEHHSEEEKAAVMAFRNNLVQ